MACCVIVSKGKPAGGAVGSPTTEHKPLFPDKLLAEWRMDKAAGVELTGAGLGHVAEEARSKQDAQRKLEWVHPIASTSIRLSHWTAERYSLRQSQPFVLRHSRKHFAARFRAACR
jgi:hypothetical protein